MARPLSRICAAETSQKGNLWTGVSDIFRLPQIYSLSLSGSLCLEILSNWGDTVTCPCFVSLSLATQHLLKGPLQNTHRTEMGATQKTELICFLLLQVLNRSKAEISIAPLRQCPGNR